ncbi:unnamed protein product [Effrenium voratum]|uniref:Uncharacterized protein n=1 Tax=Effrenium voratum TaxID=2562239 RepID=A0AA36IKW5_9DINO|nr:unnamed protein product [Effrenium voratum]
MSDPSAMRISFYVQDCFAIGPKEHEASSLACRFPGQLSEASGYNVSFIFPTRTKAPRGRGFRFTGTISKDASSPDLSLSSEQQASTSIHSFSSEVRGCFCTGFSVGNTSNLRRSRQSATPRNMEPRAVCANDIALGFM